MVGWCLGNVLPSKLASTHYPEPPSYDVLLVYLSNFATKTNKIEKPQHGVSNESSKH